MIKNSSGNVVNLFLAALIAFGCGAKTQTGGTPGPSPRDVSTASDAEPDGVTSATPWSYNLPSDRDGDTVPDNSDGCPEDPEDPDNYEDGDGCPDPDNDDDKIADESDSCPNEPETYNGTDDEDGCPDESKVFVYACPTISIPEVLHYNSSDPMIKPEWIPTLDAIAKVILENPVVRHVQVAAHTDQKGTSQYNLKISQQRAQAVVDYLIDKGVDKKTLTAAGYGEECPMNYGSKPGAFAKNKRIEFKLLETTKGCTKIQFVCEEAIKKGLVPKEDEKYLPESDYCK